jgi:hypothetical protein
VHPEERFFCHEVRGLGNRPWSVAPSSKLEEIRPASRPFPWTQFSLLFRNTKLYTDFNLYVVLYAYETCLLTHEKHTEAASVCERVRKGTSGGKAEEETREQRASSLTRNFIVTRRQNGQITENRIEQCGTVGRRVCHVWEKSIKYGRKVCHVWEKSIKYGRRVCHVWEKSA